MVALLAVLGLTAWGLTASLGGADEHPAADGWTDAGPALLRVESTVARDTGHSMPGMDQNLADPVPDGSRRLSVTVTVSADSPDGVQLVDDDFHVSGPGVAPTRPTRAQLGDGALAEGATATVELVFDVPDTTESGLVLTYDEATVPLPDLGPVPEPDGHGSAPAPTPSDPPAGQAPTEPPAGHPEDEHDH